MPDSNTSVFEQLCPNAERCPTVEGRQSGGGRRWWHAKSTAFQRGDQGSVRSKKIEDGIRTEEEDVEPEQVASRALSTAFCSSRCTFCSSRCTANILSYGSQYLSCSSASSSRSSSTAASPGAAFDGSSRNTCFCAPYFSTSCSFPGAPGSQVSILDVDVM